jgi:predicted dehydrogenase
MRKMNVAMIGYRFMGKAHSNAWRQVARFFEVPFEPAMKVICGRDEAEVKRAANQMGWAEHATRWEDVVRRRDIDIVDICTPGDLHKDIATAAAEAGKTILCEKPLANTLADAEQMLRAVERAGVIHMVCHNYRRAPAVALAKQAITEGQLGTIRHYWGSYLQDWLVDPKFPRLWRLQKARCGSGALGDIASHSVDLARHLVGEIKDVAALLKTFITERPRPEKPDELCPVDVDDAALMLCQFDDGAVGSIGASRFATGRKNYNQFEINGSRGSIVFNLERMNELELYLEEGPQSGFRTVLATEPTHPYMRNWWPRGHIIGYEHTFTHTVLDLLLAIEKGELPTPNFQDGVRNQRVLDAAERASTSGRWEKA